MRVLRAASPAGSDDGADGVDRDDHVWVAESLAGDPDAFRALFDRHAGSVRRFLRDLGRDDALADEATQETFVRAYRRLATLRDDQRLRPWLLGIARRVFLEELRRRRPRVTLDALDALPDPPGGARSPEADLLVAEEAVLFRAALARLGAERRGALLLRIDHGLTYDEIASVMGLSPAQVRNELHRGRQELRAYLAPYFEERS
jgi:RNA polymerase sigma-70 factor (ECF subfamily)